MVEVIERGREGEVWGQRKERERERERERGREESKGWGNKIYGYYMYVNFYLNRHRFSMKH